MRITPHARSTCKSKTTLTLCANPSGLRPIRDRQSQAQGAQTINGLFPLPIFPLHLEVPSLVFE